MGQASLMMRLALNNMIRATATRTTTLECDLPSLVSLGSLGSFGFSVGDVSESNATMTTVCAVAGTAMRQQRAGKARMFTDDGKMRRAAVTTTYLKS